MKCNYWYMDEYLIGVIHTLTLQLVYIGVIHALTLQLVLPIFFSTRGFASLQNLARATMSSGKVYNEGFEGIAMKITSPVPYWCDRSRERNRRLTAKKCRLMEMYRKTSNISRTLVGNKIVDNSDVVGASPVGAAPTTSSFLTLTPGFNGLGKDHCKRRQETFKFWDLVRLILEVLRFL